jgi:hexosaminidase
MRCVIFLSILVLASCSTPVEEQTWTVIPFPNSFSSQSDVFSCKGGVAIRYTDIALQPIVDGFKERLNRIGIETNEDSGKVIHLALINSGTAQKEAYELDVDKARIKIEATEANGIFYGLTTIWQELVLTNSKAIPCGIVKDEPRFSYRGFMLDESRHFFGKEKVMQILEIMASLKLNTFHWHLTDATGWRIEIQSFPKLSTVGGTGDYSNPDGPVKYYSQEDIKEVVKFAEERFITIIPEIDMPGHASAANRAYPAFSGGGSEKYPEFTFDPGNEATYTYLSKILREVAGLFSAKNIHLGGDEVHFGNEEWATSKAVKSLMKREGLGTLVDVEHYFINRMSDSLHAMNKEIAGWDEIVEAGVSNDDALIYWWRHDKEEVLQSALDKSFQTVLCPRIPLYFDFVQHDTHENGRRWKGFGTIEDVYHYPDSTHRFTSEEAALIKGIQGNLWTENIDSDQWLDFMAFSRMIALSESAWTRPENKHLSRFNASLPLWHRCLEEQGVYFFNSLDPEFHLVPR